MLLPPHRQPAAPPALPASGRRAAGTPLLMDQIAPSDVMRAAKSPKVTFLLIYLATAFIKSGKMSLLV